MSGKTRLELVLEAIDRASGPLRGVERAIDSVERAAGRSSGAMSRLGDIGGKAMRALGTAAKIGAVAGIAALVASLGVGIKEATAFQTALTEIQKKAGTTAEATARIGEEIKDLAVSGKLAVPISEIWDAYERGAAAGLAQKDLKEFAALSAKAADAFGMSASEVGDAAAGFGTGLGIAMGDMEKYFDLINALADSGISSEKDIIDFVDRSGASLKLFGQTAQETAALGATLLNLKMAPDVAARAMNTLSSKLLAPGTEKAENALADIVGDMGKFKKLLKTSPNDALLEFLDKINKLDKFEAADLLTGFLGQGFSDEVIRLAKGSDELRRNLALAGDELKWLGSLDKSYALKIDDFASQWQLFKTNLAVLRIETMSRALPVLANGLGRLSGIMRTLGERATLFQRLRAGFMGFASGLGVERIADAAGAVRGLGQAVEEFLFGVADADASADRVGRIFATMQSLGRSVRPVLDAASNGVKRFGDLLTSMGAGLGKIGSAIANGFLPHLDTLSAKFGTVVEKVRGSVGSLLDIAGSIGAALTTAFSGAGGAGVVLGDFGGKAIGVALDLYARFHTAVSDVLSVLAELSQQVAASVGSIDFAAILKGPLDGVLATLNGIADALSGVASFSGKTLVSYFKGYFDGLEPYLMPMADRLAAIWDRLGPILTNFGRIGTAIGGMFTSIGANAGAMGAVETFGRVMGNLAGIVGNVTLTGIEGLLRWVEMVTGVMAGLYTGDWTAVRTSIEGFLTWIGTLSFESLGLDLKLADLVPDAQTIKNAWDALKQPFEAFLAWLQTFDFAGIDLGAKLRALIPDAARLDAAWEALKAPFGAFLGWLQTFDFAGIDFGAKLRALIPDAAALDAAWEALKAPFGAFLGWLQTFDFAGIDLGAKLRALIPDAATLDAAWEALKAPFQGFVDWLANLSFADIGLDLTLADLVPDISAAEMVTKIKSWFVFDWAHILPKWDWDEIIGVPPDLKAMFGFGDELDKMQAAAEGGGSLVAWSDGAKMIEDARAGVRALSDVRAELEAIASQDVDVFDRFGAIRQTRATEMLAILDRVKSKAEEAATAVAEATAPATVAPAAVNDNSPAMPAIDTVRAAETDVQNLITAVDRATSAANALPSAISASLDAVRVSVAAFDLTIDGVRIMTGFQAGLRSGGAGAAGIMVATVTSVRAAASLDLSAQGANIMNTLAAGMRARAAAVVEEIRKVTQAVRDHLPSSPAKTGPLSDIHRLKFGETIASSIRPGPVVRAMAGLAAAGMDAAAPLERRIGALSEAQASGFAEPRTRPGVFASAAAEGVEAPGGGGGAASVDASMHIGAVHFSTPADKAEFEALLRRHSKAVADVVASETRRQSRLAF